MGSNGHPPGPACHAKLHQIDFAARWRNLQSEACKLAVPSVCIFVACLDSVNNPFRDFCLHVQALVNVGNCNHEPSKHQSAITQ